GYDADFEFLIAAYNEDEEVVLTRTTTKKINVKNYALTNSRDKKIRLNDEIQLLPGKYRLLLKSTDLVSNKTATRKINIKVQDYADKHFSIGDILFLKSVTMDSLNRLVDYEPTMGNNFSTRQGAFYIYFNLYTKTVPNELSIDYIFNHKKIGVALDSTIHYRINQHISSYLFKVDKDRLERSQYELVIRAGDSRTKVERKETFSFYWTDVPSTIEDIDIALKQMQYIVPHDSIDKYEDSSLDQKQSFFKRFWKKRDPNTSTEKNELKDEYFRRINYANEHYSSFNQDGWRTDRGRILIKFGFPDDIERHPFEMGTRPYVIWRYYALKKEFVFEDRTGFGDYRLHPNYLDVEYQ
ncbi:MAG: GWxTD domain-containing protein, partial [Caldithrix sp.]|nr:GWxTD domain-containing protein [Caldithrix sp.]